MLELQFLLVIELAQVAVFDRHNVATATADAWDSGDHCLVFVVATYEAIAVRPCRKVVNLLHLAFLSQFEMNVWPVSQD
jgi:hypothetical protein